MKINYINHGIASRIGNEIYINKRLLNNKLLLNKIIEHESNHSDNYKLKDIIMDLDVKELSGLKKNYYKFILSNPSTWTEFLPVTIINKKIIFSPSIFLIWIIGIITILIYNYII